MEYHQKYSNSCCFSSLLYAFNASVEKNATRGIEIQMEESLHFQSMGFKDII